MSREVLSKMGFSSSTFPQFSVSAHHVFRAIHSQEGQNGCCSSVMEKWLLKSGGTGKADELCTHGWAL